MTSFAQRFGRLITPSWRDSYGGGYYTRFEPEAKGLVKKGMTVNEYLVHQPEEEKPDNKQILCILDSEMEIWSRVYWRLSEELFFVWYIWLKDNFVEIKEWMEEVKATFNTPKTLPEK